MATLWSSTRDGRNGEAARSPQSGRWSRRRSVALVAAGLVLAGGLDDLGRAAAAGPPEPADLAGRRPAGGGRHRPVLGQQHGRAARLGAHRRRRLAPAHRPVRARVGYNGFVRADERRQGTGTSPAGTFAVVSSFGNGTDPGTALPYRTVDRNDWWPYDPRDPSTYNVLQPRRVPSARWRTELGRGPLRRTARSTASRPCWTSTCPAACTARPTGSGWPTSRRTPGSAAGSSCTSAGRVRPPAASRSPRDDDAPGAALAGPGRRPGAGDGTALGDAPGSEQRRRRRASA